VCNDEVPIRKRLRLRSFDYSTAGAYVVTVCARQNRCLFGRVENGTVHLGRIGLVVTEALRGIDEFHRGVQLDARVVMPNHVHAILLLDRLHHVPPPVPAVIGAFKARATRRAGGPIWQRSYYDRVIRNEEELHAFRAYIDENPLRWALDRENPDSRRRATARAG
jgi:REP-associated tyrosine transposase